MQTELLGVCRKGVTGSLLFLLVLVLGSCSISRSESLTGEQLQALVNEQFMSPQICKLEVIQSVVNVQLYLETPVLTLRGDGKPLGFTFRGQLDADVFSDFLADKIGRAHV